MESNGIIGIVTDPGSGLTPHRARSQNVHLLALDRPLDEQYRNLLEHYDRLISLHGSINLCPMYDAASAAAESLGERVQVIDTQLGSAGLGAAALRAAELVNRGAGEAEVIEEVQRLASIGHLFLLTRDLDHLVENYMLPGALGRLGKTFGHWVLIGIEQGQMQAPRPVRSRKVPAAVARRLKQHFGNERLRVRVGVGDLPPSLSQELKETLAHSLRLEAGVLSPMDATARTRVGNQSLAVFAYPV